MFGGEAEHDGPLKTGATPSCSYAQYSALQEKATDEPRNSNVKPNGIKVGMSEVWPWPHFSGVQQMNAALEGMGKMTVENVHLLPFTDKCLLLGDVCQLTANTCGIDTPLLTMGEGQREDDCCVHLWAPEGIVRPGVRVTLHYTVILDGPFSFPNGYQRVSSVLFLRCNNPQGLQKELTIRLRHWANVTGKGRGLCFMKANHELGSGESRYNFKPVKGGVFDQDSGSLRLKDHFCLLCIARDKSEGYASNWFYAVLCSKRDQEFRICIAYAVPSWIQAIKEYYWKDSGKDALTFDCEKFSCQNRDDAYVCLSAPTLTTGVEGGGWQYSARRSKVELKELTIDNLQQSDNCDQTEVAAGLYPPSLKFRITYEYEINDTYTRRPHKVSLTGSDNFGKAPDPFEIFVFERPTTELDTQHCPVKAGSNVSSPVQEQNRAVKENLATNRKKTAQGSSELAPGILPTPHPISDDVDATSQMASEQDETMQPAESEDMSNISLMKEWNRDALEALRGELKERVIMKHGLNDRLVIVAGGFMSGTEAHAVLSKTSNAEQMGELISILIGKSDADFRTFCTMLRNVGYGVWANELEKEAEWFKQTPGSNMHPMKKCNRDALHALRGELKKKVIMKHGLNDRLVTAAGGFMNEMEAQAVLSKPSNAEQMGELISILVGKSEADFGTFCAMLREVGCSVWANELEKKAESFKQTSASSYVPSVLPMRSELLRAETCQIFPNVRRPGVKTRKKHGDTAPASM